MMIDPQDDPTKPKGAAPQRLDFNAVEAEARAMLEADTAKAPGVRSGFADREPRKQKGLVKNLARSAAQGATFGFADEIEAGIRAPFSPRSYRDIQSDIQGQNAGFRDENPALNFGTEVAGGLATGGAVRKLATSALGAASPMVSRALTAITGNPIKTNAAVGAVSGMGASEQEGVDLGAGAMGAAIGTVLPLGLKGLARAPVSVARGLNALTDPEGGGRSIVRGIFDQAGGTDAVRVARDELAATGTPSFVMDAAGEAGMRAVRGEVVKGTPIGNAVRDAVLGRRELSTTRMTQAVQKALGGSAIDTKEAAKQVREMAGELADRSYGEVFARGATAEGPELAALLSNPTVRKAWERVSTIDDNFAAAGQGRKYGVQVSRETPNTGSTALARTTGADGRLPLSYDDFINVGKMDLPSLDALKRGLDDIIESGFDGNTVGGLKKQTRASVIALKDQVLKLADEADETARRTSVGLPGDGSRTAVVKQGEAATVGKSYREARKEFETSMGYIKALEDGGELLTKSGEETKTLWANLTPEQREIAKLGFRSQVLERIGKSDEGRDRTRGLLNSPDFKAKVRLMFGDKAAEFERKLAAERGVATTDSKLLFGSQTAPNQADAAGDGLQELLDMGGAAMRGKAGLVGYGLRQAQGMLDRAQTGLSGKARAVAARELGRDGQSLEEVLKWLGKGTPTPRTDRYDAATRGMTFRQTGAAASRGATNNRTEDSY